MSLRMLTVCDIMSFDKKTIAKLRGWASWLGWASESIHFDTWSTHRIRTKTWLIKGQNLMNKVIDSCVVCRKFRPMKCRVIVSYLPLK